MNKVLHIKDKIIGDGQPTFIVAEIGINHNGSLSMAKKLVKIAKECGADAVKFQKRNLRAIYKDDIYNDPNRDSQSTVYLFDVFKKCELTKREFRKLKKYCDKLDIIFFATPFDIKSVDFLEEIGVPVYKIASGDLTNIPLIKYIIAKKKPIILSTGMSCIEEIDFTVNFLKKNKTKFVLLHCVSTYPAAFKDINLRMIETLKKRYKIPVGYSGHERGITVSVCAVALGASIIEKHFTLDRSLEGPDHNLSLMPEGLRKMVDRIRVADLTRGDGRKCMSRGEVLTREVFAKSLVARVAIKKGQKVTYEMVDIKSPGKGLNPQMIDRLVGKSSVRDIKKNDYFTFLDLPK